MEYSKGILKYKSRMWKISQKHDIYMQEVLKVFENGFFKQYGRGRKKVLFPTLKMAAGIHRKCCAPLFTQLFSPSTTM